MIDWPLQNEATGKPQTTPTNQKIWEAAIEPATAFLPQAVQAWKNRLEKGRDSWRKDYIDLAYDFVRIQAQCPTEIALDMCQAGLQAAREAMVVRIDDGAVLSIEEWFAQPHTSQLQTTTVHGSQPAKNTPFALALPNCSKATTYVTGSHAVAQVRQYAKYGCMEDSAATHAEAVCGLADLSSLVRPFTFVLLGATSEMGPIQHLCKFPHTHVLGVARSRSKLTELAQNWKETAPLNAVLQFPTEGADMLQQAPLIAQWILETAPTDRQLVLFPLAYLDGEANVRLTVAMDAICKHVQENWKQGSVRMVYLTSPYTAYTIPKQAALDAQQRGEAAPAWHKLMRVMSGGQWLSLSNTWEQTDQNDSAVFNGLAYLQGPNYALAKTLQQWRCMLEACRNGVHVAAPHAPPTRTYSVMHNKQAAAALEGLAYFAPMVAFDVDACASLLTAIVLHQLSEQKPDNARLQHPMQLFWDGAVHGGNWRCPYLTDSCGIPAYLLGRTVASAGTFPAEALANDAKLAADENA